MYLPRKVHGWTRKNKMPGAQKFNLDLCLDYHQLSLLQPALLIISLGWTFGIPRYRI